MNPNHRLGHHLNRLHSSSMIRVKVRSTSPFAQAGLENAISVDPRFEVVTHESNPDQPADVVLLDDSDSEITTTSNTDASARIVLLTDGIDPSHFARLSQLGIRAILPRDSSVQELTAALLAASEDLTVIAPEFLAELLPAPSPGRDHDVEDLQEPLTSREREVLALLAEGAGNKEIALRLKISESTAKFHVSAILGKLGATTRTEAVTRGYRLGLILI
jgi:two-component system, NarL family, response regulator YdfI